MPITTSRISSSCCSPSGCSYIKPHDSPLQRLSAPPKSLFFHYFFPPKFSNSSTFSSSHVPSCFPIWERCDPLKMRFSSLPVHKKKQRGIIKKGLVCFSFLAPELQCLTWCTLQAFCRWLSNLKALAWDYRSHFQKLQGWPWQSLLGWNFSCLKTDL